MDQNIDRRNHVREACALHVDMDDYENAYCGELFNLGLGGAGIHATEDVRFQVGQELFLTIPYRRKPDYLIIKGKIVWQHAGDIGVEFLKEPSAN